MEEQNSMKINQLPSKTWYWLGLNDTKVNGRRVRRVKSARKSRLRMMR